jgi:dynein heavy chain, axonemal
VEVKLEGKEVKLFPTLDEIQKSINRAATAVLRCSRSLLHWDQDNESEKKATFYDMIAQDKEIVKVILLLTGSIQGTKNKVTEFLSEFEKYDWLYKDNINDEIKKFSQKGTALQNYEDKLKFLTTIEEEIEKVTESYQIGAMELKTVKPNTSLIVEGLKQWAKEWKLHFSQDLHKRARSKLDQLTEQTKMFSIKLGKDVKDIDSLGNVMETMENIRIKQAEIEMEFNPVIDMYLLLDTYLVGGITDKDEMDSRSLLRGNWDALIKQAETKVKELQRKQANYLKELKRNVKDFVKEVQDFRKDYEANGPMVEGIEPNVAMERLRRFEDEYQVKEQFYRINKRGEDLFGLQNQRYP